VASDTVPYSSIALAAWRGGQKYYMVIKRSHLSIHKFIDLIHEFNQHENMDYHLPNQMIRLIFWQCLDYLKDLKKYGIVHGDIKHL